MNHMWTPLEAERERAVEYRLHAAIAEGARLERELKTIDERLEIGFVEERSPEYPGVVPGRWHVIRHNPDAPTSFMPIIGAEGEYVDPSFQIIEKLKENDLWKTGAVKTLMENYNQKWENKRKARDSDKESMKEQGAHVFRAAKRVAGEGGMERRLFGKGRKKD
jgi:hypothetical protein